MSLNKQIRVGIFTAIGILIFMSGLFYVGSRQNLFDRTFNLACNFADISGLQKGANVWFSGVKIGIVQRITIEGGEKVRIDMKLEEKVRKFVKKDAIAAIGSDGIIGDKIVVISAGSLEAPSVVNGDTIPVENPLQTDNMVKSLSKTNDNISALLVDLKTLSSQITKGEGNIGKLFQDSTLFENLSATMSNASLASAKMNTAGNNLNNLLAEIQSGDGLVGSLLSDTTMTTKLAQTLSSLESAGTELKSVSSQFSQLTENLNQVTGGIAEGEGTVGVLLKDEEFANKIKETMTNLETSTEKLDENMTALRENFLFRRYFKKQAKKQAKAAGN